MNKKIAILTFTFFLAFKFALSQSSFYYKELGIKEGLTQSKVTSILTDDKGYLWIGTENGLNRYDRDDLKPYLHKKDDIGTLPDSRILFIAEDSLLNLWVATAKGLSLYDRTNDNFKPIVISNSKPLYVASYLLVNDGVLFGGSGSIFKFVYATQKFEILYDAKKMELYNPFGQMIKYDEEHILINSNWHGIFSFNLLTKEFKKLNAFNQKNYTRIFLDSRNRLWVSIYGEGVFCYQGDTLLQHFTTSNSPLTYNVVHDILEKDGELWLATDGGGINIISLDDFSFKSIQQVQGDLNSFSANSIYRLYLDPSNNIWAGSIRRGLLGVKRVYARSYQRAPFGNRYGLSNQTVNSFYQDIKGKIWIGTDGSGINYFDPGSSTFVHYPTTEHEKIVSIVDYSPDELLFFSFNKGLFVFDKQTGLKRPFTLVNKEVNDQNSKKGNSVFIAQLDDDNIVFSGQQIFIYNKTNNSFDIVASMGKDYVRNSPLIIAVRKQKTYFADQKNICVYDLQEKTFKTIYKGPYIINDASMETDGSIWLATSDGLCYYDLKTGQLSLIETTLFQEARTVIADKKNRVWVGTSDRLYVYDVSTNNFITLDEVDGVSPNEYIPGSTLLTHRGDVLIGGTIGMTTIASDVSFNTTKVEYSIELLDALLDGLAIPLADEQKNLEVPWDFSSIQLKVLLNEGDVFRSNLFRFRIEGFDQEFVNEHSNSLIINHLPIGSYDMRVSYYTRNGEWSAEQQLLKIIVTPPWWRTFWFSLSMCILCVCLVFCILYYYNRRKKRLQRKEIAILKNKITEEKVNFLTNISHELRTPLTLIYAPLKRIIDNEVDKKDEQRQLTLVFQQAQQMKNIVNMMLDIRKTEEGKEILRIKSHQFNEWVLSVFNKFIFEFENKKIKIVYQLDESIDLVSFDKDKCDFVLSNFLMNALKFSEEDDTIIVSTKLLEAEGMVEVMVKDEGIGLGTVQDDLLFSKFYQGTHEKGGSGIGLYYAKNLITYHKGNIGAFNNADKGATFYFQLPLFADISMDSYQMLSKGEDDQISKPYTSDINYNNLKESNIVIVEDTLELRIYLKETLSKYFKKVYVAKSGEEALPMIKSKLPDVIISDVMMSAMNGFELCKKVKTDLDISHIPFLLMTAYNSPQNMNIGYKTGADAFLSKPFEIDDLLILIHNQLKLRQNIRERYQNDVVLTHHEVSFSNADETFLIKLNAVILKNMTNQKLNVNFLASSMNVSRSLLFNKVKAITGMGIVDYVNKQRIERSIILLTTTTLSIGEITDEVGFSSTRYFSTVFKSLKGDTPSAYRKDTTRI